MAPPQEHDQALRQSILAFLATGATIEDAFFAFSEAGMPLLNLVVTLSQVALDGSLPPQDALQGVVLAGRALFALAQETPDWDGVKAGERLKELGIHPVCVGPGGGRHPRGQAHGVEDHRE
jgi:hypothetical protein